MLRKLGDRLDRCNASQRVALTIGCVLAIVLLAAFLIPPAYPTSGWFGYAPNTTITYADRPVLWGRVSGYRPWLSTLWWLGTDVVATALAVRILRTPPQGTDASGAPADSLD